VTDDAAIVVPPGEGEDVPRRYGERTVVKAAEAETRGAYAVRENTVPAGFGDVPMHVHRGAEEAFYVLEGELTVFTEGRTLAAPTGSFVLIPRGSVHTHRQPGRGAGPLAHADRARVGVRLDPGGERRPRRPGGDLPQVRPGDRRAAAGAVAAGCRCLGTTWHHAGPAVATLLGFGAALGADSDGDPAAVRGAGRLSARRRDRPRLMSDRTRSLLERTFAMLRR
jgi:quercetin dioxygenase-like cupin family protein